MNVIDVSRQSPTCRQSFREIFPLRLRHIAITCAHRPIAVSLRGEFKRRIERAKFAELAIER